MYLNICRFQTLILKVKFIKNRQLKSIGPILVLLSIVLFQCKHDPVIPDIPSDGGNGNNGGNDTTGNDPGHPCDPDTIYFERDLLPILQSACAQPGCHDAITQQDGIRLTDYASVMTTGKIKPGDPQDSELYEVITDPDPDKRMPPPPNAVLPEEQVAMIEKWILQGAQNLFCDDEECDTVDVTYSATVEPIMNMHCLGCHSDANPLGGLSLEGYNNVVSIANDGRLIGTITHEPGYPAMPKNAMKLSDCKILLIETWINNGLPN